MTDGTTVRMTYAELAAARGISIDSARRMTVRHKWPKQIGNDGLTRVDVPASALTGARTDAGADAGGDIGRGASMDAGKTREAAPIDEAAIAAIVAGVAAATDAMLAELRLQLAAERERADRAEARAREAQEAMETQMADHRRIVAMLTERIPRPRRPWWRRWRR